MTEWCAVLKKSSRKWSGGVCPLLFASSSCLVTRKFDLIRFGRCPKSTNARGLDGFGRSTLTRLRSVVLRLKILASWSRDRGIGWPCWMSGARERLSSVWGMRMWSEMEFVRKDKAGWHGCGEQIRLRATTRSRARLARFIQCSQSHLTSARIWNVDNASPSRTSDFLRKHVFCDGNACTHLTLTCLLCLLVCRTTSYIK